MDLTRGRITEIHLEAAVGHDGALNNPDEVLLLLETMAGRIGMRPLAEPMLLVIPPRRENLIDPLEDDGGVTAMLPIATSHLAIHTWPLQRRARIVIDSCQPYTPEPAISLAGRWAGARSRSHWRSTRYQSWPGADDRTVKIAKELREIAEMIPNAHVAGRLRTLADKLGDES